MISFWALKSFLGRSSKKNALYNGDYLRNLYHTEVISSWFRVGYCERKSGHNFYTKSEGPHWREGFNKNCFHKVF